MKRTLRPGEVADEDVVPSDGPAAGKKTLTAMLPPARGGGASDDPAAFPELTAMAHGPRPAGGRDRDAGATNPPRPEAPAPPVLMPRGPRAADAPSDPAPASAPPAFVDDPFALHTPAGARGPGRPAPARPPRPVGGGPTESEPEDD